MRDLQHLERYRCRDIERAVYGMNGDNKNGVFKVYVDGKSFIVIVSNGGDWEHISVKPKNAKRCPTWNEMCAIKDLFFLEEEVCVQYHPAKSNYVNIAENVLHIWRPINENIPCPPKEFV